MIRKMIATAFSASAAVALMIALNGCSNSSSPNNPEGKGPRSTAGQTPRQAPGAIEGGGIEQQGSGGAPKANPSGN